MAEASEIKENEEISSVSSTRIAAYREALWGPLMWAVDGILLLLAYGDALSKIAPSTEEWLKEFAFLSQLPWYWKIIIILAANVLLIGEGAFHAMRIREREINKLRGILESINNARPVIKLKEPGSIYVETIPHDFDDGYKDTVQHLKVRFINDPLGPYPSAKAEGVRATVDFINMQDDKHVLSMDGRWADSDQPPVLSPFASRSHLLPIEFGIGAAHILDIAYLDPVTGKCFGWNNDNYNAYSSHYHYEPHLLTGTEFRVDIHLLGVWVKDKFSFTFRLSENGFEVMRPS